MRLYGGQIILTEGIILNLDFHMRDRKYPENESKLTIQYYKIPICFSV